MSGHSKWHNAISLNSQSHKEGVILENSFGAILVQPFQPISTILGKIDEK